MNDEVENPRQEDVYIVDPAWDYEQLMNAEIDLQKLAMEAAEDIAKIKTQLEHHHADYVDTGESSRSYSWFVRARSALRHRGRAHQMYEKCLSDVRRRLRTQRATDSDKNRMFVRVAKSLLPPTTYDSLWVEVHRRKEQSKADSA